MKKITVLLLFVLLLGLFSACADGNTQTPANPTDTEQPKVEIAPIPFDQSSLQLGSVQTDTAGYYVKNQMIWFCPKGDTRFYPLCGKPNCTHADETCNAWFENANGLGCDGTRLYTVSDNPDGTGGWTLFSLAQDGTDRKQELDLPFPQNPDGSFGGVASFVFDGPRLYYFFERGTDLPLEQQIGVNYVVDVQTHEIREFGAEFMRSGARVISPKPGGSLLYALCEIPAEDGEYEIWLCQLDPDRDTVQKLLPAETISTWTAEDEKLWYVQAGEGFWEYDLSTGETQCLGNPEPDLVFALQAGDLIYGQGKRSEDFTAVTLYFFDRDLQAIDQIRLTDGLIARYVIDGKLWLATSLDPVSAYIDLSKIGQEPVKIIPIQADNP